MEWCFETIWRLCPTVSHAHHHTRGAPPQRPEGSKIKIAHNHSKVPVSFREPIEQLVVKFYHCGA